MTRPETPADLSPDCGNCAALCCIMLAFDRGEGFAIDKPAGLPCPNLSGHGCAIHGKLARAGFPACARYDCLGAGQIVTQALFAGASWRDRPDLTLPMAEAFRALREIQDMRAQLAIAFRRFASASAQRQRIEALQARLTPDWSPETYAGFDLPEARRAFQDILADLRAALREPSA